MHDAWAADASEMAAVARGDDVAFTRLYRAHHPRVFRVACGVLGDREAARDVAHECFVKLLDVAPRWQPRARVDTWLYKVALNACLSWRRRLARALLPLEAAPEPVDAAAGADDVVARREQRGAMKRALASLSPRDRALVVLHVDQELEPHEIAALLGISDNAARVALHRALGRLRARVVDDEAGGARTPHPEVTP